jgi:hypothetical protein
MGPAAIADNGLMTIAITATIKILDTSLTPTSGYVMELLEQLERLEPKN